MLIIIAMRSNLDVCRSHGTSVFRLNISEAFVWMCFIKICKIPWKTYATKPIFKFWKICKNIYLAKQPWTASSDNWKYQCTNSFLASSHTEAYQLYLNQSLVFYYGIFEISVITWDGYFWYKMNRITLY